MESKKGSSIEWLIDRIEDVDNTPSIWEQIKILAKEKHKQEIIDAYWNGDVSENKIEEKVIEYAEQYYNQTFNQ
jgi:hypothetical protein